MARKKILEGGKKDELIKSALKLFMENGYEETSVRMILDDANAVVGSFYHYFKSKEELFEEAIKLYMSNYEKRMDAIARDDTRTFMESFDMMLDEMEKGLQDYHTGGLEIVRLHWTMQYAIHRVSMQTLLPTMQKMIVRAFEEGKAQNVLNADTVTLAAIVLNGIEGIIHVRPATDLNSGEIENIRADLIAFVKLILNMD